MSQSSTQKTALVLTGGGARGAYQVGVLKYISEHFPQHKFDILVGSSAGAINIAALASMPGSPKEVMKEMEKVWTSLRVSNVFRVDIFSMLWIVIKWIFSLSFGGLIGRTFNSSLVDTTPLRNLILSFFDSRQIKENLDTKKFETVAISATEVSTGQTVTFVQANEHETWKQNKGRSEKIHLTSKHIMASAAIPFLFEPVRLGKRQYIDGSVRAIKPLGPAARLGATKILAIGVRKPRTLTTHDDESQAIEPTPTTSEIAGLILNSLFSDSLDADADHLIRINKLLSSVDQSVAHKTAQMRPIDFLIIRPSQNIGQIAADNGHLLPVHIRYLLGGVGAKGKKAGDILSYLLFEKDFVETLITLGYADAKAQHAEIEKFFK